MISYNTACEMAGFTQNWESPRPIYTYFAYKNGEVQEFTLKAEAKSFSNNVEPVIVNQKEIDDYKNVRKQLESDAYHIWYDALKKEYSHLNTEVFSLCYERAWDDGHAYGLDEVAREMDCIVQFVDCVMKATK